MIKIIMCDDNRDNLNKIKAMIENYLSDNNIKSMIYTFSDTDEMKNHIFKTGVDNVSYKSDTSICVHTKDGDIMIKLSNIEYVESSMRLPHYITKEGTYTGLMLRESFKSAMAVFTDYPDFYMCGASFILNLANIKSIDKIGVTFTSGRSITLPKSRMQDLKRVWSTYWLER